jgi:hypothetical protein
MKCSDLIPQKGSIPVALFVFKEVSQLEPPQISIGVHLKRWAPVPKRGQLDSQNGRDYIVSRISGFVKTLIPPGPPKWIAASTQSD